MSCSITLIILLIFLRILSVVLINLLKEWGIDKIFRTEIWSSFRLTHRDQIFLWLGHNRWLNMDWGLSLWRWRLSKGCFSLPSCCGNYFRSLIWLPLLYRFNYKPRFTDYLLIDLFYLLNIDIELPELQDFLDKCFPWFQFLQKLFIFMSHYPNMVLKCFNENLLELSLFSWVKSNMEGTYFLDSFLQAGFNLQFLFF